MEQPQHHRAVARVLKLMSRGQLDEALKELQGGSVERDAQEHQTLLRTIKKRQSLLEQARASVPGRQVSKAVCVGCGAELNGLHPESLTVVCRACGVVHEVGPAGLVESKEGLSGRINPPRSFLTLGRFGHFGGERYEVIGRISYWMDLEEWDSEDKEYCSERWQFDEWTLLGEDRSFVYLVEDDEGFYLSRDFEPSSPLPELTRSISHLALNGWISRRVQERGYSEITAVEGELTWVPRAGEQKFSAEYKLGGTFYSLEWRECDGTISEVECFESEILTYRDMLEAFDEQEALKVYGRVAGRKSAARVVAVVCFLVSLGWLIVGVPVSQFAGRAIYSRQVPSIGSIPEEGLVEGPIQLSKLGTNYAITVSATLPGNSDAWVGVELLDHEQDAVNAVQGDFWDESGYDEGEHWHESDVFSRRDFRLSESGEYYLRVFAEPGTAGVGVPVEVKILEGVSNSRTFVFGGILAGVIAGLFLIISFLFDPIRASAPFAKPKGGRSSRRAGIA
jgi:Domain of unknown function (DUF4178)